MWIAGNVAARTGAIILAEFKKEEATILLPYLLVMTGVPVTDAATSEKVLHDVRQTIAELVNDVFYATLKNLAHEKGCSLVQKALHLQW